MKFSIGLRSGTVMVCIVVIALLMVGAAWYYEANRDTNQAAVSVNAPTQTNTNAAITNGRTNSNTAAVALTLVTIEDTASLTLKNCVDDLATSDMEKYDFLKSLYAGFHPELSVTDAGSYCEFSNGMKIVSFAYQALDGEATPGQSIAVFDADNNYINETADFYCPTLGDLLTPHFKSLNEGMLTLYCWSGDGAIGRYEEYSLNLSDFSYEKTISEESEDVTLESMLAATEDTSSSAAEPAAVPVTKTAAYAYNDVLPTALTTPNEYSIATVAQVRQPTGITLSDIEVTLYDSPLLDTQYGKGRVSDVQCNSDYCLMTIRSAGWQYKVLKFQNGSFTDLTDSLPSFDPGGTTQVQFAWNGEYWLVVSKDGLYRYNGSTFNKITIDLQNFQQVNTMAWNGNYWLISLDAVCCIANQSEILHMSDDGEVSYRQPILASLTYPAVHSISWGKNAWLIAASDRDDRGNKRTTKLLRYAGTGQPEDVSAALPHPDTYRFEHLFWDGSRWLMHFLDIGASESAPLLYSYDGSDVTDVSDMLSGFSSTSISTISGRPSFYAVAGYIDPVANVVQNGSVRDLSGYFAMGVYSGTTYGNQVFIGGESELEILTFHYEPRRVYTSDKVNDGSNPVTAVTLHPTQETPAGTAVSYEVSQDGGQTWQTAEAYQQVHLSGSGADLRWRAILTTSDSSQTPSISYMAIDYVTTE